MRHCYCRRPMAILCCILFVIGIKSKWLFTLLLLAWRDACIFHFCYAVIRRASNSMVYVARRGSLLFSFASIFFSFTSLVYGLSFEIFRLFFHFFLFADLQMKITFQWIIQALIAHQFLFRSSRKLGIYFVVSSKPKQKKNGFHKDQIIQKLNAFQLKPIPKWITFRNTIACHS